MPMGALFLKFLSFKRRKGLTSSITRKNLKKWHFNYKNAFQCNNNKALFKKRALIGPASWHALSNKKKYLTLYRTLIECRWRYVVEPTFWEKRETSFEYRIFEKTVYFVNISAQTNDKILIFVSEDPPWKALQNLKKQISLDLYWDPLPYRNKKK